MAKVGWLGAALASAWGRRQCRRAGYPLRPITGSGTRGRDLVGAQKRAPGWAHRAIWVIICSIFWALSCSETRVTRMIGGVIISQEG
ncbi:hypothetical protein D3C71_1180960 [compost metagenome]